MSRYAYACGTCKHPCACAYAYAYACAVRVNQALSSLFPSCFEPFYERETHGVHKFKCKQILSFLHNSLSFTFIGLKNMEMAC